MPKIRRKFFGGLIACGGDCLYTGRELRFVHLNGQLFVTAAIGTMIRAFTLLILFALGAIPAFRESATAGMIPGALELQTERIDCEKVLSSVQFSPEFAEVRPFESQHSIAGTPVLQTNYVAFTRVGLVTAWCFSCSEMNRSLWSRSRVHRAEAHDTIMTVPIIELFC